MTPSPVVVVVGGENERGFAAEEEKNRPGDRLSKDSLVG